MEALAADDGAIGHGTVVWGGTVSLPMGRLRSSVTRSR